MRDAIEFPSEIEQELSELCEQINEVWENGKKRLFGFGRIGRNRLKKLLPQINKLAQQYPDEWFLYFLLGKIYQSTRNHQEAVNHFKQGLRLRNDLVFFQIELVRQYTENNQHAEASLCIESALESSNDKLVLQHASLLKIAQGNLKNARDYLKKAYEQDHKDELTHKVAQLIQLIESRTSYQPNGSEVFEQLPHLVPIRKFKGEWFLHEQFPNPLQNPLTKSVQELLKI